MKISHIKNLIHHGQFSESKEWKSARRQILKAVKLVDWPPGSGSFTIRPQSGKKRGEGNGVKPIKAAAIKYLAEKGWKPEHPWPVGGRVRPGNVDAACKTSKGLVAFEWETGNVSSSHRSLNKMALGLLTGSLVAGILVVPSRKLYPFLTDRIGNYDELEPYFPLWSATPCQEGVLEIVVIEQDAESSEVRRIPKGTDGRAAF